MDYDHFMGLALEQARRAYDDGEFPVGCVVVHRGQVVATGNRRGSKGKQPNETEHAEMIALEQFAKAVTVINPPKATLFCTMEPCLMCYGAILLAGIGKIVYAYEDVMGGGTGCDLSSVTPLYRTRSVEIVPHILRQESLQLFKDYFNNPANSYWRDSLLARHTLSL